MAQFNTPSGIRYFACEGCGAFFNGSREFGEHRRECNDYRRWTQGTQRLHPLSVTGNPMEYRH